MTDEQKTPSSCEIKFTIRTEQDQCDARKSMDNLEPRVIPWPSGKRWFMPIYEVKSETVFHFEDGVTVLAGNSITRQWKHWAAPAVYWLWLRWQIVKEAAKGHARLIAAAPQLLEACEAVSRNIYSVDDPAEQNEATCLICGTFQNIKAREHLDWCPAPLVLAAIAAARGTE